VIIGGVATRAYMPERMTKELDILIQRTDGDEALRRWVNADYTILSPLAVSGYLLRSLEGVDVDVLFGAYRWLPEALRQPNSDPAGHPVLALPYLVLMKLVAQRAQDWADVSRMLGWAANAELDAVRAVVARYSPEDLDDLESLIYLGRQEQMTPDGASSLTASSVDDQTVTDECSSGRSKKS
jgi:hypothetical protein